MRISWDKNLRDYWREMMVFVDWVFKGVGR
jgi:hypothetical protein